ncbi:cysteine protease ATG4B isoform X2 [Hylaeus anthracinus]|uniref:cysteine protease ATG4B isoform X2 n=1 Tax=Hylaeus volcanicus TaxID=313075 RepID=UPI0023B7EB1E|nr:cysteine protease ATG4B isoform X2 [Hylaeus volcanicus]XP_054006868.1 cysteine protease ATG4B isoform X2 [Hylaeus anthracinus]
MDSLFTQNITDEPDDIPQTDEPVWVLGRKYNAIRELDAIRSDIRSKLWFTYRKGFPSIGGYNSSYTSDRGWGCMLRCGQMVLGQALITLNLGRDWQWEPEKSKDSTYLKILERFEDKRTATYSIHQIALTGESEGKEVGQWFGPNTIAQVLKKLVVYDEWDSITIHVALDNMIIINDILKQCRIEGGTTAEADGNIPLKAPNQWKPLLLLIPLRLGLSEINPIYIDGLKNSLKIQQSLGIIGGKPNYALYIIGYVGNEIIYLDPHTTQRSGSVEDSEMDATYHCKSANRIPITGIDPSVALCFLCPTEHDFKSLCKSIQEELITPEKQPLLYVCTERLPNWSPVKKPPLEAKAVTSFVDFEHIGLQYDTSDEDFELLG